MHYSPLSQDPLGSRAVLAQTIIECAEAKFWLLSASGQWVVFPQIQTQGRVVGWLRDFVSDQKARGCNSSREPSEGKTQEADVQNQNLGMQV